MLCESDSAKLHGYLPLQINEGLSLLARGCESGNSTDQSHWLTLPEAVWKEIGRIPGRSAGGNGVFEVLALSAEADRPEFASSYPPYPEINPQTQRTLKITAPAEAFIFLSNLYYFAPLEITEIVLSAGDTQIRHEDEFATLLQCVNCGVEWVEWEITVNAGSLSPLDLVAF